jgi:integrase/recombinase XerD
MSGLSGQGGNYLRLRRASGHELDDAHRLLPHFAAHLDTIGAETVTVEAALSWASRPDADPANSVWMRRMNVARGFARHMPASIRGLRSHLPGPVTSRHRRRQPFIYSDADIAAPDRKPVSSGYESQSCRTSERYGLTRNPVPILQ